jgi:hypothetical protein
MLVAGIVFRHFSQKAFGNISNDDDDDDLMTMMII